MVKEEWIGKKVNLIKSWGGGMNVKREALRDGYVLRALVVQFVKEKTDQHLLAVLRYIRDSYVWIPCSLIISETDKERFIQSKKGDIVSNENEIRLVPDILQNEDGYFFPVFSNCEQMGEEYGSNFSHIEKHFFEAISLAMAQENVSGIVLDAFTQPFVINKELYDFIGELPSNIEE